MSRKIDYDEEYRLALENNIREVRDLVLRDDAAMNIKLSNYSEKFGIPLKFLKHKILQDNLFANIFIKDPSKQSLHQRVAANFIKSITDVMDFVSLPAGGRDAIYICTDGIVRKGDTDEKGLTKSIDFCWTYDGNLYYAAHKYTKDEGGAQDNQFKDLTGFLINAAKSKTENTYFLAIGDGDYYQRRCREGDTCYSSRIEYMNDKYSTENAVAITTDDLENYLIDHSSNRQY